MQRNEAPQKASTVRAAYWSYRDAAGHGDNAAIESAFLAGVAWAFSKIHDLTVENHDYVLSRMNELAKRAVQTVSAAPHE